MWNVSHLFHHAFQTKLNVNVQDGEEELTEEVEISKVENYVIIHSHNKDGTKDGTIMHDFQRVTTLSLYI